MSTTMNNQRMKILFKDYEISQYMIDQFPDLSVKKLSFVDLNKNKNNYVLVEGPILSINQLKFKIAC